MSNETKEVEKKQARLDKISRKLAKMESKHYNSQFWYEAIVEPKMLKLLSEKESLDKELNNY